MKLDAKFYGQIKKVKDDSILKDDEYVVFLAKDNAFALTILEYRANCVTLGADQEQIAALDRMIDRLQQWRNLHPDLCKTPDARGEKLLDQ